MTATPETPQEQALIADCKKAERNQLVAGLLLQNKGICPDSIELASEAQMKKLSEIPSRQEQPKAQETTSQQSETKAKSNKRKRT